MFQRIINLLYRYPKSALKKYKRFDGYFNYLAMLLDRRRMLKASVSLPALHSDPEGPSIFFLTGKKHFYQTLFCIHSLYKTTKKSFNYILVDDGSFDMDLINRIQKQLPGSTIVSRESIDENLDKQLPAAIYPNLNRKRRIYPHLKKLTDIHTIPHHHWKLVLDSDMLFFQTPHEILDWLNQPDGPIHMLDCMENYGYSRSLMEALSGNKIPRLMNVGVIGMNSSLLHWGDIERWLGEMEEKEGSSYYLEQALTAMIIAGMKATVLNANHYVVNPSHEMILNKKGILHHYVDISKRGYYKFAWQDFIHE